MMIRILLLCMASFAMNHHHHSNHQGNHHGQNIDFGLGGNYYGGNVNQQNGNQGVGGLCCLIGCVVTFCVIGGIAFFSWEKAKEQDYLTCPHTVSVVPASTNFIAENSSICLATGAVATKVCYKKISSLILKCITINGSGTGTTSNCTKSVQDTINSENEKMVKQIYPEKQQQPITPTEEFPSGYKVTNGANSNGYVLRFSNNLMRSGCVDRCQPPMIANDCGSLAEMRIDENFKLLGSSWTITFPHLKTYGQNLKMEISENWNPLKYLEIFKRVKHTVTFSNGVKGEIEVTYLDGEVWYHYCNSWLGIFTWDNRCNAQRLLTGEQKVPLEVVGKIGNMKWIAKSTFTVWNFLKNGVTEIGPSSESVLVLKGFNNSLTGIDDQQVKIVNKDSVDPTAFATLYIARYYTNVMEKAWNKAAEKDKFQEEFNTAGENDLFIDEPINNIM